MHTCIIDAGTDLIFYVTMTMHTCTCIIVECVLKGKTTEVLKYVHNVFPVRQHCEMFQLLWQ